MRICFVIFSLSTGGAEKVATSLVNHWASAGHQVTLITIESHESDFYKVDERISRVALGLASESAGWRQFISNNVTRLRRVREAVMAAQPNVVVSFLDTTNVLVLLAMLGSAIPVVVSERTDPRCKPSNRLVRLLRRAVYPRAHTLVVQTREVGVWAHHLVGRQRVRVIPNGVKAPMIDRSAAAERKSVFTLVSMGRLGPEKGFDLLLRAFARCAIKHPDWRVQVIGDGPERRKLAHLAHELGIGDRVTIDSITREPAAALVKADLFVLSSLYEGFPNALLEAMALGLPVISYKCPSGPAEIIRDGVDGLLVAPGNVPALADAMDRLMSAENERRHLSARAPEVTERFAFTRVMRMWDELLERAAA